MIVALEDLKKQCNVDFDEDDTLILKYGAAAERWIEVRLNCKFDDVIAKYGRFPEDLEIAILMIAAHWYRVREAVTSTSQDRVPYGVASSITPYKEMI